MKQHRVTIPCKWSFEKRTLFHALFVRFSCASPWLYRGIFTAKPKICAFAWSPSIGLSFERPTRQVCVAKSESMRLAFILHWSLALNTVNSRFRYVVTWNVKTYVSHPLKCRMCQNWLKWCSDPPPPTTTPKLQLDFLDLKSSWSLGVVVGGVSDARPSHHLKLWQENLKICIQWHNVSYLGFSIGFGPSNFLWGVGGIGGDPHACAHAHTCSAHMCMHDRRAWLQTGRKQRNFRHFGT